MTIKEVVDFYLANVEKVNFRIQLIGGIKGKYHILTKNEVYDFINGYEEEEIVSVIFQDHSIHTNMRNEVAEIRKMEIPHLYIEYK